MKGLIIAATVYVILISAMLGVGIYILVRNIKQTWNTYAGMKVLVPGYILAAANLVIAFYVLIPELKLICNAINHIKFKI